VQYGDPLEEVVLLPADAPAEADVVWLLRQVTSAGRLADADDDQLLLRRGLRVVASHAVPGSNTALVVQRWER
jgi:hypothetical protein